MNTSERLVIKDYGPDLNVIYKDKRLGSLIVADELLGGYFIEVFLEDYNNVLASVGYNKDFKAALKAIVILNDLDESLVEDFDRVICDP